MDPEKETRIHHIGHDRRLTNALEFMHWLSTKKLIITGRYHTVTMCIKIFKTPFLYFKSNTPKIGALCDDIGLNRERKIEKFPQTDIETMISKHSFSDKENQNIDEFFRLCDSKKSTVA